MSTHKQVHSTADKQHAPSVSSDHRHRSASRKSNQFEPRQYLIVGMLMAFAFFAAYSFARGGNGGTSSANASGSPTTERITAADASARAADGTVRIENGVQKISVKVGYRYSPDVIQLKAGVPAEITFGEGQGCTAVVQSQSLGFQEDLSSGPKTVKLQGLQPGTYEFACGMNMVRGQIVVS